MRGNTLSYYRSGPFVSAGLKPFFCPYTKVSNHFSNCPRSLLKATKYQKCKHFLTLVTRATNPELMWHLITLITSKMLQWDVIQCDIIDMKVTLSSLYIFNARLTFSIGQDWVFVSHKPTVYSGCTRSVWTYCVLTTQSHLVVALTIRVGDFSL